MDILINGLIYVLISSIVCFVYDLLKSYLLTKKIKQITQKKSDSWSDFWDNIPTSNDFEDKEGE